MKSILQSLIIAFSMYSKIPMPRVNWEDKNLKYAMCFFPFVGLIIGAIVFIWYDIASMLHFSRIITTTVLVVLPVMLTGGIHMDGFLDTIDALSSNQTKEDKLRILSDPHAGAFAIIFCGIYYILVLGFSYEISKTAIPIIAIGFILSRSMSALSVVSFKMAKNTGLAHTFSDKAVKNTVRITSILIIAICIAAMLVINVVLGGIATGCAFLTFLYYRRKAYKNFGGITGDLCGYFLQLCELILLIGVVGGDKIWFS